MIITNQVSKPESTYWPLRNLLATFAVYFTVKSKLVFKNSLDVFDFLKFLDPVILLKQLFAEEVRPLGSGVPWLVCLLGQPVASAGPSSQKQV